VKIAGFLKVRNEIVRGNLYRALENLEAVADGGIVCDDASSDGTREHLQSWVATRPTWELLLVDPAEQAFEREMGVKQRMLDRIHGWNHLPGKPDWIWWLDADETVERPDAFRRWLRDEEEGLASRIRRAVSCEHGTGPHAGVNCVHCHPHGGTVPALVPGYKYHYTQLWKGESWARTDGGFDDGVFLKLWRYRTDLSFDVGEGTHRPQFPKQIDYAACPIAPFEVTHWGNASAKHLVWKAIQYANGRGGVDRHIHFGHPRSTSMATGKGWDESKWAEPSPTYRFVGMPKYIVHPPSPEAAAIGGAVNLGIADIIQFSGPPPELILPEKPEPFTLDEIRRIRSFGDLHQLRDHFTVCIPAYNRAKTLPRALDSLLYQTYDKWIAIVLDDGSSDDTHKVMREYQDRDPRIFYARYPYNRGGVAMNELGMAMACEFTEWWTRLGSDDWFGREKLARDAVALRDWAGACYGSYTVNRDGRFGERCNPSMSPKYIRDALLGGRYMVSWANCAVRTSALRGVRERWGCFVDRIGAWSQVDANGRQAGIRNMDDFLLNARLVATGVEWVWRGDGVVGHRGDDPVRPWSGEGEHPDDLEAVWTCAESGGASSPEAGHIMAEDERITRERIAEMAGELR
jgi:glycosyltransferase involved in cell wall biosynthesis